LLIEMFNQNRIKKVVISDINKDLINLYKIIRKKPDDLIAWVKSPSPLDEVSGEKR